MFEIIIKENNITSLLGENIFVTSLNMFFLSFVNVPVHCVSDKGY